MENTYIERKDLVLDVKDLNVTFKTSKYEKHLVQDMNFSVAHGECLGILGESGSGKSMAVKSVLGLLDSNFHISGTAIFEDRSGNKRDLLTESKSDLRLLRGNQITMVLQNPMTCFDPLYRIGKQMSETFLTHHNWNAERVREKSLEVLDTMQIHNGSEVLEKYPHQLSGGMLQRIMIGLAMALEPKLLIADEPTTAIDAITQFEILREFKKIKKHKDTAMIFISHDLGAISEMADKVIVINSGKIVDRGDFHHIMCHANDFYTKLLIEKRMSIMNKYTSVVGDIAVSADLA